MEGWTWSTRLRKRSGGRKKRKNGGRRKRRKNGKNGKERIVINYEVLSTMSQLNGTS